MLAQLNHLNSDTPSDIGRAVSYQIEQLEEQIRLNKVNGEFLEMDEAKSKLAYLNHILNAANALIYFLNAEFNEDKNK